jgi:hypothetical protein
VGSMRCQTRVMVARVGTGLMKMPLDLIGVLLRKRYAKQDASTHQPRSGDPNTAQGKQMRAPRAFVPPWVDVWTTPRPSCQVRHPSALRRGRIGPRFRYGLGTPPIGWMPCSSTVVPLPAHPGRRFAATPLRFALGCDRTAASRLKIRETKPIRPKPSRIPNVRHFHQARLGLRPDSSFFLQPTNYAFSASRCLER